MNRTVNRFGPNYRGNAILNTRLADKYCCKNKEANNFKIMSLLNKDKFLVNKIIMSLLR